jgi:hypothetical protein
MKLWRGKAAGDRIFLLPDAVLVAAGGKNRYNEGRIRRPLRVFGPRRGVPSPVCKGRAFGKEESA